MCRHSFRTRKQTGRSRRGLMLAECLAALAILGVVVGLLPTVVAQISRLRADERFERLALLELTNLTTRLQIHEGLTEQHDSTAPAAWFRERYPQAELSVLPGSPHANGFPGQRPVRLSLTRPRRSGQPDHSVELTVWLPAAEED